MLDGDKCYCEKESKRREMRSLCTLRWGEVRESLSKVREGSIVGTWEKIIPGIGDNIKCKGPEAEVCCPACRTARRPV